MNRRKFLSFLAAVPFIGKALIAAPPIPPTVASNCVNGMPDVRSADQILNDFNQALEEVWAPSAWKTKPVLFPHGVYRVEVPPEDAKKLHVGFPLPEWPNFFVSAVDYDGNKAVATVVHDTTGFYAGF